MLRFGGPADRRGDPVWRCEVAGQQPLGEARGVVVETHAGALPADAEAQCTVEDTFGKPLNEAPVILDALLPPAANVDAAEKELWTRVGERAVAAAAAGCDAAIIAVGPSDGLRQMLHRALATGGMYDSDEEESVSGVSGTAAGGGLWRQTVAGLFSAVAEGGGKLAKLEVCCVAAGVAGEVWDLLGSKSQAPSTHPLPHPTRVTGHWSPSEKLGWPVMNGCVVAQASRPAVLETLLQQASRRRLQVAAGGAMLVGLRVLHRPPGPRSNANVDGRLRLWELPSDGVAAAAHWPPLMSAVSASTDGWASPPALSSFGLANALVAELRLGGPGCTIVLPLALGRSGPDGLAPAFDLAAVARTRVTHRKPEPNPAVASPSGLMAAVGSATFPAGLMITPAVQSSSTLRAELRRRELQAAHRNADEDDADTDSGGLRPQLSPDAPADGAVPWRPEMLDELRAHRARLPGSMPKLRALCALVPEAKQRFATELDGVAALLLFVADGDSTNGQQQPVNTATAYNAVYTLATLCDAPAARAQAIAAGAFSRIRKLLELQLRQLQLIDQQQQNSSSAESEEHEIEGSNTGRLDDHLLEGAAMAIESLATPVEDGDLTIHTIRSSANLPFSELANCMDVAVPILLATRNQQVQHRFCSALVKVLGSLANVGPTSLGEYISCHLRPLIGRVAELLDSPVRDVQLSAAELLVSLLAAVTASDHLVHVHAEKQPWLDDAAAGGLLSSLLRLEQAKAGLPVLQAAAAGIAWLAELPELRATIAEQGTLDGSPSPGSICSKSSSDATDDGSLVTMSAVIALRRKCVESIAQATATTAARSGSCSSGDGAGHLHLRCDADRVGRGGPATPPGLFGSGWVVGGCRWNQTQSGGPRQCPDFRLNPQLRLTVSKPTTVSIALALGDDLKSATEGDEEVYVGLQIYAAPSEEDTRADQMFNNRVAVCDAGGHVLRLEQRLAGSTHLTNYGCLLTAELPPSPPGRPHVVVCFTHEPGCTGTFAVSAFGHDGAIELSPVRGGPSTPLYVLRHATVLAGDSAGGGLTADRATGHLRLGGTPTWRNNPQYCLSVSEPGASIFATLGIDPVAAADVEDEPVAFALILVRAPADARRCLAPVLFEDGQTVARSAVSNVEVVVSPKQWLAAGEYRLLSMNDAPGRRHQQLLTLFTSHPDRLALSLESPQRLRSSDGTLSSFEWPFSVSFGGLVAVERGHGLGEDGAADEATNGLFSLPQLLVDLDVSPPVNEPATVCVLLTCPDPSLYVGFKLVVDRGRKPGMLQRLSPEDRWIWETEQPESQSFCPLEAFCTIELAAKEALLIIPGLYEGPGIENPADLIITVCSTVPIAITPLPDRVPPGTTIAAPPPPRLALRQQLVTCEKRDSRAVDGNMTLERKLSRPPRLIDRPVPLSLPLAQQRRQQRQEVAPPSEARVASGTTKPPPPTGLKVPDDAAAGTEDTRSGMQATTGQNRNGMAQSRTSMEAGGSAKRSQAASGDELSRLSRQLAEVQQACEQLQADLSAASVREAGLTSRAEKAEQAAVATTARFTAAEADATAARSEADGLVRRTAQLEGDPVALESCSAIELRLLKEKMQLAVDAVNKRLAVVELLASLAADFKCPITQDRMVDPVVAADGQTYERQAVEAWLADHETSPMTGEPLAHKVLIPNNRLKSLMLSSNR